MHRVHGNDQVCRRIAQGKYMMVSLTCTVCCRQYRSFGDVNANAADARCLPYVGASGSPCPFAGFRKEMSRSLKSASCFLQWGHVDVD